MGPISLKRGLRHGDPISPYLFLLCVESLPKALTEAATDDGIHGCRNSPNAPEITYLLFVDDRFLFFQAMREESTKVKALLNEYEMLRGQAVNFQKSCVFFNANVRRDKQEELAEILGVYNDLRDGKYMGLPSLIGRTKKAIFNFLKDRVVKKIQGWSNKIILRVGKVLLIKNIA